MTGALDVAVNLTWLAPGRVGGSEQYLTRQLAGLTSDCGVVPTLYCHPGLPVAHPELAARFTMVSTPGGRDWRGLRLLAEHSWLPAVSRDADLSHHGGGTVPVGARRPIVLTIHDLQYLTHPQYFSPARLTYLRAMMPRSARRATVITTPSEYVRGTVIEAFGVDAGRVVVVVHGIPDTAAPPADQIAVARSSVGMDDRPYLIYPAITHPHKEHVLLVDMLRHLPDDLQLVLIGGEGAAESTLQRAITDARVETRVVRPGRVDGATRDALIAGAAALVFPSEYEGFGAPLAEAMSLGTPVVCSSAAAVREVVGDSGVVVTDSTGQAWADAVEGALSNRQALVAAGFERRKRFTIAASGAALASAYRQAGEVGSRR